MLNKIVIVGRMTKDAKIYDNEEVKIATFSVATERNYKDENDEIACDYIFCKAFGKMASNIEKYTSQGSLTGFSHPLDLNQISTLKDREKTHAKLFGKP